MLVFANVRLTLAVSFILTTVLAGFSICPQPPSSHIFLLHLVSCLHHLLYHDAIHIIQIVCDVFHQGSLLPLLLPSLGANDAQPWRYVPVLGCTRASVSLNAVPPGISHRQQCLCIVSVAFLAQAILAQEDGPRTTC